MLTENRKKIIRSLDNKKYRQKYHSFVIEGIKLIKETIDSYYEIDSIYTTKKIEILPSDSYHLISEKELQQISFLKTHHQVLGVVRIPENKILPYVGVQLILDQIQDPGNFGTIIRLADWFGIKQIICSEDTVDLYNPKVIQASMGSFTRVNIHYTNLEKLIEEHSDIRLFTADLSGKNIYEVEFPKNMFLLLGNEGNGVKEELKKNAQGLITIPQFNSHQKTESLNVAMATGIILGQLFSKR